MQDEDITELWGMYTTLDIFNVTVTYFQLRGDPYTIVELWWESRGKFRRATNTRIALKQSMLCSLLPQGLTRTVSEAPCLPCLADIMSCGLHRFSYDEDAKDVMCAFPHGCTSNQSAWEVGKAHSRCLFCSRCRTLTLLVLFSLHITRIVLLVGTPCVLTSRRFERIRSHCGCNRKGTPSWDDPRSSLWVIIFMGTPPL